MTSARSHALILAGLLAFAAVSFLPGAGWGLPSRDADPFLFGRRTRWTGAQVMALAGPWSPPAEQGADRPQHAAGPSTRPTVLNATDADRAEIVRRYRLYSNQPDEMITFRALSRMRPAQLDLDPRLYQYGGLWVYPVGGLLRLAAAAHLLTLRTDLAFYLDHPEAFARFYRVARLYSAAWGLVGVVVVYSLTLELTIDRQTEPGRVGPGRPQVASRLPTVVAATAAGAYAAMPVVVNAAHEAKPHLAGAVLTLAAVWAAARFVRTGRRWWPAAVLAGAAAGMVLTGAVALIVLPVMAYLVPARRGRTAAAAIGVALLTFVATNPYLPFDAIVHPQRTTSNLGNTGGMYHPSVSIAAVVHAGQLLVEGISPVTAIVALLGGLVMARRAVRPTAAWLLAIPAAAVAVQFALLATDKPDEYARFAITLDVALAILAAATVARLPLRPRESAMAGVLLVVCTALFGMRYDLNFLADDRPGSTRRTTARQLAALATPGRPLVVSADPAPYALPPVDLFTWQIVLVPRDGRPTTLPANAIEVRPTDVVPHGLASPISWANKPFVVGPARQR